MDKLLMKLEKLVPFQAFLGPKTFKQDFSQKGISRQF